MNVDKIATRNSTQLDIPFEQSINRITMPNHDHYYDKKSLFPFPSIFSLSFYFLTLPAIIYAYQFHQNEMRRLTQTQRKQPNVNKS